MVLSDSLPVHPLKYFLLILLEEPILFKHKDTLSISLEMEANKTVKKMN